LIKLILFSKNFSSKVNTLAITKPEKATMVENTIIQMARSGQIVNKFGEDQLKSLLERVSEQTQKKTVVKV
jgi:programmed cell death protein 5